MSVEYKVYINSHIFNSFEDIIKELKNKSQSPDDFFIHKVEEGDNYFIYGEGSIRGIWIYLKSSLMKKWIDIKINAFSSIADWELFYTLVENLKKHDKVKIYEESDVLIKDDDFKGYITQRYQKEEKFNYELLSHLLEKERYMTLPVFDYDIVIYKDYYDSIKNDSNVIDKINQYLAEKSALYMSARRAGIFQLNGDKRIAVWNFDAVLLNEVDYVAIVKNENTNDHILVTWDTFLKTKGVRYEQISRNSDLKYYYIYRVSNNEIDEMYNEFNKNAISLEKN